MSEHVFKCEADTTEGSNNCTNAPATNGSILRRLLESPRNLRSSNKLRKYEDDIKKKEEVDENETKLAESILVGERCEVTVAGQVPKRGVVKYVGKVHFSKGIMVGIEYDEQLIIPLGKHDASVEGKRYFECKSKYGGFVRPSMVEMGEFRVLDEFDKMSYENYVTCSFL